MSKWGIYDWIKGWTAPRWLKVLLQAINDLMISILVQVGKGYVQYVQASILEAASHSDWSNEKKFDYVFKKAKEGFVEFAITLKDAEINMLIEQLVNLLKKQGVIQ